MSVGPEPLVRATLAAPVSLASAEGELLAVRISIEPRWLEKLLDALAHLEFPISPQIYHQAALRYIYADGHERWEPTTTVEFPAYARWLPSLQGTLEQAALPGARLAARSMLEDLKADCEIQPGPAGSPYHSVIWYRRANGAAGGRA